MDLDTSICKKSNDSRNSIMFLVKRELETMAGKYFFQLNPAALSRLDESIQWLRNELEAYEADPVFLANYPVHVSVRKRELKILMQMNFEWQSRDQNSVSTLNKVVFPCDFKHP